jgi:hypothetical protein
VQALRISAAVAAFAVLLPIHANAQLRPLERFYWDAYFDPAPIQLQARVGWFDHQRAALAGTVGRLIELGEVRVLVRTGAVILEFAGTPQRLFRDERVFAEPTGGAGPAPLNGERHDAGDYRVATAVRLNSLNSTWLALLRFGTRLPTTNNRVGLDRDQLDFFALLGAHHGRAGLRLSAELGLGIHGTRSPTFEQSDVLLYSGTLAYAGRHLRPGITIIGQDDLSGRNIRGNEDLSEVRAGLRIGRTRWAEFAYVHGLRTFSPRAGLLIGAGVALKGW